jgi:hypothetical protein
MAHSIAKPLLVSQLLCQLRAGYVVVATEIHHHHIHFPCDAASWAQGAEHGSEKPYDE